MLRVYSILYLQQVWTRPKINESGSISNQQPEMRAEEGGPFMEQEPPIIEEEEGPLIEQEPIVSEEEEGSLIEQKPPIVEEEEPLIEQEPIILEEETNMKKEEDIILSNDSSIVIQEQNEEEEMVVSLDSCSSNSEPPVRSDTHMTFHDREYYDDDVTLSEDEEDPIIATKPPHKYTPKQILHRAKSTITEESVKKLRQKTGLFLEKINSNKRETSLPILSSPLSPPTPLPLKGIRRQSLKLTTKGKTLTKKLKRAISFHQQ